jgi:hypothetical protein
MDHLFISSHKRSESIAVNIMHSISVTACSTALLLVTCFSAACHAGEPYIRITSPSNRALVHGGDTVSVDVSASGENFVFMLLNAEIPLQDDGRQSPPWKFSVHIPETTRPGLYSLFAAGIVRPGKALESPAVYIDVEKASDPVQLSTDPESVSGFHVGERQSLALIGRFADNPEVRLTESTRTTFVSESSKIVAIDHWGEMTAIRGRIHANSREIRQSLIVRTGSSRRFCSVGGISFHLRSQSITQARFNSTLVGKASPSLRGYRDTPLAA